MLILKYNSTHEKEKAEFLPHLQFCENQDWAVLAYEQRLFSLVHYSNM